VDGQTAEGIVMTNDLTPVVASPLDEIRRVRIDGSEFWSARDLMTALGYPTWQHFAPVTDRAACSAENQGMTGLFTVIRENSGGRPREDFHLSRFAAYLVAMNGDPRKPEVAAAQQYFAVKTREAEVADVRALVPTDLPSALRAYARELEAHAATRELVAEMAPKAEYVDTFVSNDDLTILRAAASKFDVPERQLRELLVEKRWIYKTLIGRRFSEKAGKVVDEYEWRAYAEHRQHFRLLGQHNAPRHHNNQLRQTLYVTPDGLLAIEKLLTSVAVTVPAS
jgi:DNA-damage-inducible protein D